MAGPEAKVERWARAEIGFYNAVMEKHVSPQKRGVRDNLVMWPCGEVDFIEFKAPGEPVDDHQIRDHERCRAMKQRIYVIRSKEEFVHYCRMRWHRLHPAGLDK